MHKLFMFVYQVTLIIFIIGMFKPNLVLIFINKEKRNKKNVLKIYGLLILVLVLLVGITNPDYKDDVVEDGKVEEVNEETIEESKEEIKEEPKEEIKKIKEEPKEEMKAIVPSVLSEEEYKELCIDLPWEEVVKDKKTYVGTYLKKDLMVRQLAEDTVTGERVYICGEKKEEGSYVGGTFNVYDNRIDQSPPIEIYDKIYVYGQIEGIYSSFSSYHPDFRVKYVEFNGKFGE